MNYRIFTVAVFCISLQLSPHSLLAQQEMLLEEGREILAEKGISEEELRQRLIQKGYDPDRIKPEDLPAFQEVLEQTVAELEAEKKAAQVKDTSKVVTEKKTKMEKAGPPKRMELPEPDSSAKVDTKSIVQVYGHQIFRSENATFYTQPSDIAPPESYIMGIGDKLTVSIFGQSQLEENLVIDRQGFVAPKNMFRIALRGKTLAEAKDILRRRYRGFYIFEPGEFDVTVNTVRSITVNIMGEAVSNGALTLPAINTLFNALVAAGGPTDIGSVRRIRLISEGKEKLFDVYRYMLDPGVIDDFYLKENDYIHVPVADRVVSIDGAVRRPFRYELVEGEQLKDVIDYAGGLTPDAYLKDIQIHRYSDDKRLVINLNLRTLLEGDDDFILYNGDEITITSIDIPADNYAEISGAVIKEGTFALQPGMRISDLLEQSELKKEARRDFAYVLRYRPDGRYVYKAFGPEEVLQNPGSSQNIELSGQDMVFVLSQKTFADTQFISIDGAVRAPGRYAFSPGDQMVVRDALLVAGGALPRAAAFGYIVRRDLGVEKPRDYVAVNLAEAMDPVSAGEARFALEPYDSLYIFDESLFLDEMYVDVSGEVHSPGRIRWDESLTVTDVLRLAGGLNYKAAYNRIDVSRVILSETEPTAFASYTVTVDSNLQVISGEGNIPLNPFDHVFVRSLPSFQLQRTVKVAGEVMYPGIYPITTDNERIASIVGKAGGLTSEAYPAGSQLIRRQGDKGPVVIQLKEALANPTGSQNLIVEHGDTLYVPRQENLVTIEGAVRLRDLYQEEFLRKGNRINVVFEKHKNAKYYIDTYAAGVADNGMKKLITVEHPNGRIERTVDMGLFKIYPRVTAGSTIKVGYKPQKEDRPVGEKETVDWGSVLRDTLAQATAVLTLILLIDRASE